MSFAGIELEPNPGQLLSPLVPSSANLGVSYARCAGVISRLPLAVPDLYLFRTRALVCFEPHPSRGVADAQP